MLDSIRARKRDLQELPKQNETIRVIFKCLDNCNTILTKEYIADMDRFIRYLTYN